MLNRIWTTALLIFNLIGAQAFADKAIPAAPRSYVYDEPHLLSSSGYQQISRYLGEQDRRTGNQVLVAIFNSTDGEDPVDYTNRLFKAWNPGQKGKDNGVLLAIYLKEKRTRIEVGYGLEPVLTDAKSARVLNSVLKPAFQQQQFDAGILSSVKAIHETIENPNAEPPARNDSPERLPSWAFLILFGGIFGFLYLYDRFYPNTYTLSSGRRMRRRSPWDDRGFGGGGGFGGSGGFGGGGFSGGGGSSGGGGASGSW